VFYLYANQEEVDLADNDILEVVFGLVVLELDVKAIFDTNFHLDRVIAVRWHAI